MTILSDYEIEKLCTGSKPMIEPFVDTKTRIVDEFYSVPSFGLGSYGYDITLSGKFKIPASGLFDPMHSNLMAWNDVEVENCYILEPNSFVLAVSNERFNMPNNITGTCLGKSSYARCGMLPLMTPIEAGWQGYLTLEFANVTKFPIVLYVGGGIAQVLFFKGQACKRPYGNGIYQNQGSDPVTSGENVITN